MLKPCIGKDILEMADAELNEWLQARRIARTSYLAKPKPKKSGNVQTVKNLSRLWNVPESAVVAAVKKLGIFVEGVTDVD